MSILIVTDCHNLVPKKIKRNNLFLLKNIKAWLQIFRGRGYQAFSKLARLEKKWRRWCGRKLKLSMVVSCVKNYGSYFALESLHRRLNENCLSIWSSIYDGVRRTRSRGKSVVLIFFLFCLRSFHTAVGNIFFFTIFFKNYSKWHTFVLRVVLVAFNFQPMCWQN